MGLAGSIDFVIQAKDLTSKPTADIVAALENLNLAQKSISDSAEAASTSSQQYADVQKSLLTVIAELDKRLSDVSKYQANVEQLNQLRQAIEATKTTYAELTARLIEANEAGNKPVAAGAKADLKSLGTEITALTNQYNSLQRAQDALLAKGKAQGVNLAATNVAGPSIQNAKDTAVAKFGSNQATQAAAEEEAKQQTLFEQAEAFKRAQLAETAAFQKQLDEAANRNARNEYEQAYLALLEAQDKQLAEQAAQQRTLLADTNARVAAENQAAEGLAKYQQIGAKALTGLSAGQTARSSAAPSAVTTQSASATSAVTSALDPLAQQAKTLSGLQAILASVGEEFDRLGTTAVSAEGKIAALKDVQDQLATVSKGLATSAGLIDALNRQNLATDAAKTKLAAAEAEVLRLATAIQDAAVVDDKLSASLVLAQQRVQGAAQAILTQQTALDRAASAATAAGVDVDNLAAEELKLAEAARTAAAAQEAASTGIEAARNGAVGFGGALDKLAASGLASQSIFENIKSQVLGLATAYLGVQGVIEGLGSVLKSVQVDQSVNAQLVQITGSTKGAAEEYAFLQAQALRTGYSFEQVAKAYTSVARQATEYGVSQKDLNNLIANSLTTTRSLGSTTEQMGSIFLALGEIFDSTTIQTRQLRVQFGNAGLAGVTQELADVMKNYGVPNLQALRKAMEEGQVPAEAILPVFDALAKKGKTAFDINTQSFSFQLGTLKTQLYNIELQFAKSGFLSGVTDGLTDLAKALQNPEVQQDLKALGATIGDLIRDFADFATSPGKVQDALTILEAYLVAKFSISLISSASNAAALSSKLLEMGGAATTLGNVLGFASKAGLWGALVGIGIELGNLIDKIPGVTSALAALDNQTYTGILKTAGPVGAIGKGIVDTIEEIGTMAAVAVTNLDGTDVAIQKNNKDLAAQFKPGGRFAAKPASAPSGSAAASTDTGAEVTTDEAVKLAESATNAATAAAAKLNDAADKEQLKTRKQFLDLYAHQELDATNQLAAQKKALQSQDQNDPGVQKALADNIKASADLQTAIQTRAQADYDRVASQANDKRINELKTYENARQQAHERTNATILASDTAYAKATSKLNDDSLAAREDAVKAEIAQQAQTIQKAIDTNNQLITKGKSLGAPAADIQDLQSQNALLQAAKDRLASEQAVELSLADQKFALDQQTKAEQAIKNLVDLRAAQIDAINEKQKNGQISPDQANAAKKQVDANLLPNIDNGIDAIIATNNKYIQSEADAGRATDALSVSLQTQNAQLTKLKASTDAATPGMSDLEKQIDKTVSTDTVQGFDSIAQEVSKAASGAESFGTAWKNAGDIILNTIADILISIGEYIIKQQLLNALQASGFGGSGGSGGGGFSLSGLTQLFGGGGYGSEGAYHSGGIVGSGNMRIGNVPSSVFAGAPRMHSGGVAGLKSDEVPAILQKNEEVLTTNNPRHIMNQTSSSVVGAPGGATNIHMHADAESFFNAGLSSKGGDKTFKAYFAANRKSFSQILGK